MHKILFAHSDQKLLEIYRHHLARHFSFDSAVDGLSALRKLRDLSHSMVVADYNLPVFSGAGLLKFVRAHTHLSPLPFIFLTTHPDPYLALGLGASDWLDSAQTNPEQLIEKLYYHLKINFPIINQVVEVRYLPR